MSEVSRINDQLKRAHEGEAWSGPGVREILDGVTAEMAAARPLATAHTIWEIVLHIATTHLLVLRRFHGDARPWNPAEDWPSVTATDEAAWRSAVKGLEASYDEVRQQISQTSDAKLDEPILPSHSSTYVTLHGLIQHDLYHAGQIALLKKALTA
jgi:uncharacterized damage-inducible protein DinB